MFSCSFLIVITCGKNTGHRQFFRVTFTGTTKLKRPDHKGVKGKIIPFYSHTQNNFTCKHTTTQPLAHIYTSKQKGSQSMHGHFHFTGGLRVSSYLSSWVSSKKHIWQMTTVPQRLAFSWPELNSYSMKRKRRRLTARPDSPTQH